METSLDGLYECVRCNTRSRNVVFCDKCKADNEAIRATRREAPTDAMKIIKLPSPCDTPEGCGKAGCGECDRPETPAASPAEKVPAGVTKLHPADATSDLVFGPTGYHKLVRSRAWGNHFEDGATNPNGVIVDTSALALPVDFLRVPSDQWQATLDLYFHFLTPKGAKGDAPDSTSECSVIFARKRPLLDEWRTFVPRQEVGKASVRADLTKLVDILTGEEFENGLPEEWAHAGSSHSHNDMGAFFSGTDDANELDVPGLHVVVGRMRESGRQRHYTPLASIVRLKPGDKKGKRFIVEYERVLDIDGAYRAFHPKCLEYVTKYKPTYSTPSSDKHGDWVKVGEGHYVWRKKDESGATNKPADEKIERDLFGFHGPRDFDNIQEWLNSSEGRLSKRDRKKSERTERLPILLRESIKSAREETGGAMNGDTRNAIRAICNAIEKTYDDDKARKIISDICASLLLARDGSDAFTGE